MKPLLVGESTPFGADPRAALWPYLAHHSGGRLAEILGLTAHEYLRTFDRTNLLALGREDRWSACRARDAASAVVIREPGRALVLLGTRVSAAFGVPFTPFETTLVWPHGSGGEARGSRALVLPHPSGMCRIWNDPTAAPRAARAVAWLVAEEMPRYPLPVAWEAILGRPARSGGHSPRSPKRGA